MDPKYFSKALLTQNSDALDPNQGIQIWQSLAIILFKYLLQKLKYNNKFTENREKTIN